MQKQAAFETVQEEKKYITKSMDKGSQCHMFYSSTKEML